MAKAKKSLMGWKDHCGRWLFGLAALLGIVCIIPVVPWRRAAATPVFHGRFSNFRSASLISMTDKNLAYQPFSKWKREMCMLMKTYATPDLLSSLAGAASTVFAQKTGFSPATAMGCKMWQICKDHVSIRCNGYTTLMATGFGVMAMILLSVGMSVAVPCLIASDVAMKAGGKKKKQKKEAAMFNTMVVGCVGLGFSAAGLATYHFVTDSVFNSFQTNAYYPYPAAHMGYYILCAMIGFQTLGALCVVTRLYPIGGSAAEKGDAEEEDENPMIQQSVSPMGFAGAGPPIGMSGPPFQPGMPMAGRAF